MSGRYTGAMNPHNDLSRSLTKTIRKTQPSLRTIGKWRQEWIEKGLDRTITFETYRNKKLKEYNIARYNKKKQKLTK